MAAPVTNDGVLNCLVQQVSNSSPLYDATQQTYQVKYKGPYSVVKELPLLFDTGTPLADALQRSPLQIVSHFSAPSAPAGKVWTIQSIEVEEIEAGSHAILTLKCIAKVPYSSSGSGGEEDPYSDTWNLKWESYTMKPFGFCSNEAHSDYPLTCQFDHLDGPASREHIEMFMNGSDKGVNSKGRRWYRDDSGNALLLNDAENLVLNKELEGKSALWHYPVLTHTTVREFTGSLSSMLSNNISYGGTIGDGIDHIIDNGDSNLRGCPYTFPADSWMWVKTGDDMQHTKSKSKSKVSFTRTETFMGVISADVNFYGNVEFNKSNLSACRWNPGSI